MLEQLNSNKIIPVAVIDDIDKALPLGETLLESGISTIEITLRSKNALAIIAKLVQELPELLVGAGTILNQADFLAAKIAGAKYIISPGITQELLATANDNRDVKFIPGVCTPSQVMETLHARFNHVKFFPAEPYNAHAVLKSLLAVMPQVKFCPTGGIALDNMSRYLELPNVFAVGLSAIVETNLITTGDFRQIRIRAQQAVAIANYVYQ